MPALPRSGTTGQQSLRPTPGHGDHRGRRCDRHPIREHPHRRRDRPGRAGAGHRADPPTPPGTPALLDWTRRFRAGGTGRGRGTGAYGAGLARLRDQGVHVVEVDQPDRKTRRFARQVRPDRRHPGRPETALVGERTRSPRARRPRRGLRGLRVAAARRSTSRPTPSARIKAQSSPPPDGLRDAAACRSRADHCLRQGCLAHDRADAARHRPPPPRSPLRSLARRHQQLSAEIAPIWTAPMRGRDQPRLVAASRVGANVMRPAPGHPSATTTTGSPPRPRSPCSAAPPIPPRPGKTTRHRLGRGGDRQANAASTTSCACAGIHAPAPTPNDAPEGLSKRSSDASGATSPASSTRSSQRSDLELAA